MTWYSSVTIILSNSQLNKLNSGKITVTEVTLKFLSNVIGDSNGKINFLHRLLLLIDRPASRLRKTFANN